MDFDLGQALATGLGSGLTQVGQFTMQQQAADAENQRWLEREKQLQASRMDQEKQLAAFRAQLEPPKTDAQEVTDPTTGTTSKVFRQWQPPTADQIAQGQGGSWQTTGTGPAVDVERLAEQGRHNVENENNAQARLALQGDLNVAKIDAAESRAALDAARTANGGSNAGKKVIWSTDAHGQSTANLMDAQGNLTPLLDANNQPVTSQKWRQRGNFSASGKRELPTGQTVDVGQRDEIGPAYQANAFDERPKLPAGATTSPTPGSMAAPVFVDPSDPSSAPPMKQFAPKAAPQSAQPPGAGGGMGTSPNNPIPYQPGMPKPPTGTYVKRPDGQVVQVQ